MAERIPQSVAIRVPLQAFLATDHVSPATGLTIVVTISKNGGGYGNPSNGATTAVEIANGSYYVDLSTTDTGTVGPLFVRGAVATMDPITVIYNVVAFVEQTGDCYTRLGAPVGASVAADVAATKALMPTALVGGRMDASVGAMASGVLTATAIAADAITDAKVASDVTIASVTGAVGSVTGNVGGNVTGSVGSVASFGTLVADIATAVWAATTRLLTAGTNIALAKGTGVTGFNDLDAAGVRAAAGLASANLDAQLDALPTNAELATALGTADDAVLTQIATVSAKLPAALVGGRIDANVGAVNGTAVTGAGTSEDPWGP